jgi:hypothetical protein
MADVRLSRASSEDFRRASSTEQIQIIIRATRGLGNPGDFQLLASSLGFIIISYFAFLILFDVLEDGLVTNDGSSSSGACPPDIMALQLQVIGSLAFIGAFVAAVRIFMRGLAAFDLSAYTFLKQTIEMLASILLIIVAFLAFPDPFRAIGDTLAGSNETPTCAEIPWYWMALAPALALLPESSSSFLLARTQSIIKWVKRDDDRFVEVTRVILSMSSRASTISHVSAWNSVEYTRFRTWRLPIRSCLWRLPTESINASIGSAKPSFVTSSASIVF